MPSKKAATPGPGSRAASGEPTILLLSCLLLGSVEQPRAVRSARPKLEGCVCHSRIVSGKPLPAGRCLLAGQYRKLLATVREVQRANNHFSSKLQFGLPRPVSHVYHVAQWTSQAAERIAVGTIQEVSSSLQVKCVAPKLKGGCLMRCHWPAAKYLPRTLQV